jgi:hypothetical protein
LTASVFDNIESRVARWFICKPKNPNFGILWKADLGMESFGTLHGNLAHFVIIWYVVWHFQHFAAVWSILPILVYCTKENLATLIARLPKILNVAFSTSSCTVFHCIVQCYLFTFWSKKVIVDFEMGVVQCRRIRLMNRRSSIRIPPGRDALGLLTFQLCRF